MDSDDLGFGSKSRSAKSGRRAGRSGPSQAASVEEDNLTHDTLATSSGGGPPVPSRRVSGWGEDPAPKRLGRRGLGEGFEPYEDERLRPRTPDKGEESDDNDIPVIPDLEDQQEDEITTKVAVAPTVAVNRVATYIELDNDLLRQAAFLTLDNDIDLKILTRGLSGEADLVEEDKVWEWDRLFTEVTSDLTMTLEKDDTEEKDSVDR
ncbi:intraflagellar transport protein 43 homolog [Liolophura sinensis]|uniref:intraflagellar transport protein 43 homolog n=1 Tax=Liolophura sinensis TaxID=3198878 RepID=UPI0031592AE1